MVDILSAFGLTVDNLDLFGFNGVSASNAFGEQNVIAFVENVFDSALPSGLTWDGADYFNFAKQADEVISSVPGVNFSYVDYFNQVNAQMVKDTGHSLSDLHVAFDGHGNITGTVDGVGSATVNINDAIHDALSDPAVIDALNNANSALSGTGIDITNFIDSLNLNDLVGLAAA